MKSKSYSIGIDLGGTNILVALVDAQNNILAEDSAPTRVKRPYTEILADMQRLSQRVCDAARVGMDEVHSIGAVSPGSVNKDTGIVHFAGNLYWENVPLRADLTSVFGIPVFIENDANAAAFGEYTAGAAQDCNTVLVVTLGTGIGGGFVEHGRIYEGFNYAALEVGHMVIKKNGRPCTCGRRGCFESYGSATGLIQTAKEYMEAYPKSLLWELTKGDPAKLNGKMPFDAMRAGDEGARNAVDSYLDDLACGLANLINIFQPEIIIIGGGLSNEGEALLMPLRERIAAETFTTNSAQSTKIMRGALGARAGVVGAANLYREFPVS